MVFSVVRFIKIFYYDSFLKENRKKAGRYLVTFNLIFHSVFYFLFPKVLWVMFYQEIVKHILKVRFQFVLFNIGETT